MSFLLASLLGVASPLAAAAEQPRVEVLGTDRFRVSLADVGTEDYAAAQGRISAVVARLCQSRSAQWGRFELTGRRAEAGNRGGPFRFSQEITCVAAQPALPARAPAAPPSAADEAAVRTAFARFFALRDAGDAAGSEAMLSPGTRALGDAASWRSEVQAQSTRLAGVKRDIVGISWTDDPPGAEPGRYAALDFNGASPTLAFSCGYLALHQLATGGWEVSRIEEMQLPRELVRTRPAAEINAILEQGNCAVRLSEAVPSTKPAP